MIPDEPLPDFGEPIVTMEELAEGLYYVFTENAVWLYDRRSERRMRLGAFVRGQIHPFLS